MAKEKKGKAVIEEWVVVQVLPYIKIEVITKQKKHKGRILFLLSKKKKR